jgi:hypothetical protein
MPFVLVFPIAGLVAITIGVLTAVFNERSAKMQKWYAENLTLFGHWTSRWVTPGRVRVGGIFIAAFGVVYLSLSPVILFASLRS